MRGNKPLSLLLRGFMFVVLVDLFVIALVAGIGWWSGWTELAEFQRAIQVAGLLVMGLGLLGVKGNLDQRRSIDYKNSPGVIRDESWKLNQQTLLDLAQNYAFILIMSIAGMVCLAIGWLM